MSIMAEVAQAGLAILLNSAVAVATLAYNLKEPVALMLCLGMSWRAALRDACLGALLAAAVVLCFSSFASFVSFVGEVDPPGRGPHEVAEAEAAGKVWLRAENAYVHIPEDALRRAHAAGWSGADAEEVAYYEAVNRIIAENGEELRAALAGVDIDRIVAEACVPSDDEDDVLD